jgi:site-specific DNA-cytosine methylase
MPSKTIKAGVHGVAGGEAMLREIDGSVRYLSIREAALVQGFPQDYEFPGVRSRVMGVIGNAVAVDVAARVGRALVELRAEQADRSAAQIDGVDVVDLDADVRKSRAPAAAIA